MLRRGQAYVGAFLQRSPAPPAEGEGAGGVLMPDARLHINEHGEVVSDSLRDPAADLHDVGTFAQVQRSRPAHGGLVWRYAKRWDGTLPAIRAASVLL